MDLALAVAILGAVAGIGFPLLARRDLLTKLQARDESREEWRSALNERMQKLENIPYRVDLLERYHFEYKDWKHEKADPYINDYAALELRIRRIEAVLNGRLK